MAWDGSYSQALTGCMQDARSHDVFRDGREARIVRGLFPKQLSAITTFVVSQTTETLPGPARGDNDAAPPPYTDSSSSPPLTVCQLFTATCLSTLIFSPWCPSPARYLLEPHVHILPTIGPFPGDALKAYCDGLGLWRRPHKEEA